MSIKRLKRDVWLSLQKRAAELDRQELAEALAEFRRATADHVTDEFIETICDQTLARGPDICALCGGDFRSHVIRALRSGPTDHNFVANAA